MALTKRQKDVLDFIADFVEENGYSPSYEELAQGLKLASLATVHKHIQALESRNYLRRLFNQSRSLEVSAKYMQERRRSRQTTRAAEVPLAGRIAAGSPVEAIEGQDTLQFADFAGKGDTFALQVTGESMIEDHILAAIMFWWRKHNRPKTVRSLPHWWTVAKPRSSASIMSRM